MGTNHFREGRFDAETATTAQSMRWMVVWWEASGADKVSDRPSSLANIFTGKTSTMVFLSLIPWVWAFDVGLGVFSWSRIHRKP